jgi:McrBC 5-methylcytosine restriction system component
MQSTAALSSPNITSDIVCDEAGTPNARHWEGLISDVGSDYNAILLHAQNKTIRIVERSDRLEIHGRDRVGVIALPSGRRILLRTKIPGMILLDWLVYLQEFPDLQLWASGGNVQQSDSWQTVLAKLFLSELEIVTRCHLRKGFIQMNVDSPHVRGRVLAGRLSQRPWRLPSIPQVLRSRSLNTPANQMLSAALDQLLVFQADLGTNGVRLFQQLRNDWSHISHEGVDRQTIIHTSLSAPPDGYRSALQLARLLLTGATIDHNSGFGGQTFTLSLSRIWELSVTRLCQDLAPQTGWKVAARSQ